MEYDLRRKSINSFIWKTIQSIISLGMTFVIQIVLARMLMPDDFGIIAISTTFMTLANTIIETSFSSAIIQRERIAQTLISSVFYINLLLSVIIYTILFGAAPLISDFYEEPILTGILRIQGIRIVFSGMYSIQQAIMNRKMRFKAMFFCNLLGTIAQAIVGFAMAYVGTGVWALVYSTLAACFTTGIAIIFAEPWRPSLQFSLAQVKSSLNFSAKILAIRVFRKVFYNIRVLVIGRVCSTEVLGYFNKGFQFPSTAMTVVDGSLTSVAFTSLSRLQNDQKKLTMALREYVRISMFLCVPMMIGMALVAKPLVIVLLTDKWINCVPFLQIICFTQLLVPLNVKTTAFEAIGRSDLSMKLHLFGIFISIVLLAITIPFGAYAMTFSGFISNMILQSMILFVTDRTLSYTVVEQIQDVLSGIIPTIAMIVSVIVLRFLPYSNVLFKLITQIGGGILAFSVCAILTKNSVFIMIWNLLKKYKRMEKDDEKVY